MDKITVVQLEKKKRVSVIVNQPIFISGDSSRWFFEPKGWGVGTGLWKNRDRAESKGRHINAMVTGKQPNSIGLLALFRLVNPVKDTKPDRIAIRIRSCICNDAKKSAYDFSKNGVRDMSTLIRKWVRLADWLDSQN